MTTRYANGWANERVDQISANRAHHSDVRYPWDCAVRYRAVNDRCVRVEKADKWGLFDIEGSWLDGPMLTADPAFCRWVLTEAGTRRPERMAA